MDDWLARRFDDDRDHLHAVAYRILGSRREAEDAVQESWLHVSRGGTGDVRNLTGWLTTVVARVCLDMLRARGARPEEPVGAAPPEQVGTEADPEQEVLLADSVGLALLVVLDRLGPAERVAFVLHDLFAVPFDEIAPVVHRSVDATRQLASRARRRVRGASDVDNVAPNRELVDAFLTAARTGDVEALVALLAPDVVARSGDVEVRGARNVAEQALTFARLAPFARPAPDGIVVERDGRPTTVLSFTVDHGRIAAIDITIG